MSSIGSEKIDRELRSQTHLGPDQRQYRVEPYRIIISDADDNIRECIIYLFKSAIITHILYT